MPHLTSTICSRRAAAQVLFGPGGSAAGPKPGRDSFSALLGGGSKFDPPRVFANCRKYPTRKTCTQSFAEQLRSRPRELWPTRSVRRATPPAALRRHVAASSAHLAATYLIENSQLRFSVRLCRHGRCGRRYHRNLHRGARVGSHSRIHVSRAPHQVCRRPPQTNTGNSSRKPRSLTPS